MKVLDLFAGLGGWSGAFRERGHDVVTVDLDPRFGTTIVGDILTLAAADLPWRPDIILASPPCEGFSVLRIGRNWHHRSMGVANAPKTATAELGLALVEATVRLIDETQPRYFVIENPRAMLRKLPVLATLERRTVTYCQYGHVSMKPTDLWGGFPPSMVMRPMCAPRADCHISSPRGSRTGIQSDSKSRKDPRWEAFAAEHGYDVTDPAVRAVIPYELALAVCEAAEHDLEAGAKPIPTMLWGAA